MFSYSENMLNKKQFYYDNPLIVRFLGEKSNVFLNKKIDDSNHIIKFISV